MNGGLFSVALTALMAFGAVFAADVSEWVNPLIGTSAIGHAFPAACVPFGLVQAGPDTGNGSWHYCNGYRYEDKTVAVLPRRT